MLVLVQFKGATYRAFYSNAVSLTKHNYLVFFMFISINRASLMFSFSPFCNWFPSLLLSAVHGLSSVPLQQQPPYLTSPSRREGVVTLPSHRTVERTRSEPPPYSHSPLTLHASHHSHTQHQLLQQYHKGGMERFKQNTHLSKVRGGTIMSRTNNVSEMSHVTGSVNSLFVDLPF